MYAIRSYYAAIGLFLTVSKDLARIQKSSRVEGLLDPFHHRNTGGAYLPG